MKWGTTKTPVYVYATSSRNNLKQQLFDSFLEEAFKSDQNTLEIIQSEYTVFEKNHPTDHYVKSIQVQNFLEQLSGTAHITISQNNFHYISIGFNLIAQGAELKRKLTHKFVSSDYAGWFLAQRKILGRQDVFIGDLGNLHLFLGIDKQSGVSGEKMLSLNTKKKTLENFSKLETNSFLR